MPYATPNPYEIEPDYEPTPAREEFERVYSFTTTLKLTQCTPPREYDLDLFCPGGEGEDVEHFINFWLKRIGPEAYAAFADAGCYECGELTLEYSDADRVSLELLDKHPQFTAEYESGAE